MSRGRRPTPTDELKRRGTYRPDRHRGTQLAGEPLAKPPTAPKHLSETEKAIWKATSRRLVDARLLTINDLSPLESYCVAYATAIAAEAVVAVEGRTVKTSQGLKRHPEQITAEKARAEMRKYEQLFGMSPADRARIRFPDPAKPRTSNPFADTASSAPTE